MFPRSQRRQMRTIVPHRAHLNSRASAAATASASRGLYNARHARDPGPGYPVHRATAAGDQEARVPARASPSAPLFGLPHLPAPEATGPPLIFRWVTSHERPLAVLASV
jgi:hypothetical protein